MKLSRNVSITLEEAKEKARHFIKHEAVGATATCRAWRFTVKIHMLKLIRITAVGVENEGRTTK